MDTYEFAYRHVIIEDRPDNPERWALLLSTEVRDVKTGLLAPGASFLIDTFTDLALATKQCERATHVLEFILRSALNDGIAGRLHSRDVLGSLGEKLRLACKRQCSACVFWNRFTDGSGNGVCLALSGKVPESPTRLDYWTSDGISDKRVECSQLPNLIVMAVTRETFWCAQHQYREDR